MKGEPSLAIVVPFFNEEKNVVVVCIELRRVLDAHLPGAEVF